MNIMGLVKLFELGVKFLALGVGLWDRIKEARKKKKHDETIQNIEDDAVAAVDDMFDGESVQYDRHGNPIGEGEATKVSDDSPTDDKKTPIP